MCLNATASEAVYQLPVAARYLSAAVSALSALSSLTIILTHLVLRCLPRRSGSESQSRLFIVFLSVADLSICVLNALGSLSFGATESDRDIVLCQVQAVLSVYFNFAFLCWIVSFIVFLFVIIVRDNIRAALKYIFVFHLLSWGLPLVLALVTWQLDIIPERSQISSLGGINHYSRATVGWCWIGEYPTYPEQLTCADARLFWMLVSGRGWEIVSYVVMPLLVVLIHRHVTSVTSPLSYRYTHPTTMVIKSSMKSISNRAYALIGSFILLRIWGTIRIFFDYGDFFESHSDVNEVLTYLQAIGDNAQGIVNLVLFIFLSPKIKSDLKVLVRSRCPCCCCCCEYYERRKDEQAQEQERRQFHDQQTNYRNMNYASPARSRRILSQDCQVANQTWGYDKDARTSGSSVSTNHSRISGRPRPFGRKRSGSRRSPGVSQSMELTVSSASLNIGTPNLDIDIQVNSAPSSAGSRSSRSYLADVDVATPIEENVEPPSLPTVPASVRSGPLPYTSPPAPGSAASTSPAPVLSPRPDSQPSAAAAVVTAGGSIFHPPKSGMKTPLLSDTDEMNV